MCPLVCILCVSSLDQWVICVSSLRIFFVCPLCVLFGTVCDLYVLFAAFTSTTTQVSDTGRIQEEAELYTAEGRVEVIHQLETTLACLHRGWCKITMLLLLLSMSLLSPSICPGSWGWLSRLTNSFSCHLFFEVRPPKHILGHKFTWDWHC